MNPSAAYCTSSAYQPGISAFQGEGKNLTVILEEGKGVSQVFFFPWVWMNRNKHNSNYPPTVADCLTLVCFIFSFCYSTHNEVQNLKAHGPSYAQIPMHTGCSSACIQPALYECLKTLFLQSWNWRNNFLRFRSICHFCFQKKETQMQLW